MSVSSIVDWTPFELLIYISRVLLIILSAGFLGSLAKLLRKVDFKVISKAGKMILVMLVLYSVNVEVFYLGYVLSRPVQSFGALKNIGDIVFLILGILMCKHASHDIEERQKKPVIGVKQED